MTHVDIAGHRVHHVHLQGEGPTLVMLHEGLGSVGQWRDLPERLHRATGLGVVVYDRPGYGQSDVVTEPLQPDFMHRQAYEVLPALRQALGLDRVVLFGHSDGASIALLHAAAGRWPGVQGVVAEAPHVYVEEKTVQGAEAALGAFRAGRLGGLARYHQDHAATFHGWNDVWLSPAFRSWDITAEMRGLSVPTLAIQGEGDEYGTMAQLDDLAAAAPGPVTQLRLAACGHSAHRDAPEMVVGVTAAFVALLGRTGATSR